MIRSAPAVFATLISVAAASCAPAQEPRATQTLTVELRADGVMLVQGSEISAEQLVPAVRAAAEQVGWTAEGTIFVYGNDEASYRDMIGTMQQLKAAGFERLALVTDPAMPTADE